MNARARVLPLAVAALLVSGLVRAQDPAAPPTVVEGPPLPEQVQSGEALEPEVRIIRRDQQVIEEYRQGGRLYMVRVIPRGAPPYYLVDSDGDGRLDTRWVEASPGVLIPSWILFSW
ncbi:MAG: DUF2782 domain-containing protein [Gammaproteobacteria bacterium]|jgi:hypothetical protein|nr:DUF2782 domain-containing protein [Gammaproteobacteria bacterium]